MRRRSTSPTAWIDNDHSDRPLVPVLIRTKSNQRDLRSVEVACRSPRCFRGCTGSRSLLRYSCDHRRGPAWLSGRRVKITGMNAETSPILESTVVLAMDYGQFCLDGGLGDIDNEIELLEQAQAEQPSAGDGTMVVVVCPHQNNFEMSVDVQVFDRRPAADRSEWQQVSEDRLEVDAPGVLSLSSPTTEPVTVAVPPGQYVVEVSGRGFVNYGWPGSTTPGDVWRLRLWPDDCSVLEPAQRWEMPGYGIPENTPSSTHESGSSVTDES